MTALAFAPLIVSMRTQFLRPTVNGLIARSAYYLDIRIIRVIHRIFLSSSFAPNCINPAFPC